MTERHEQALTDAKSALELSNRVPHQAIELAKSALSFSESNEDETTAYAFAALGSCYASLGRLDEAARHINEAQKLAFELRLTYIMARVHQARGWIAYCQGNSVLAFSDWQIAFDYFQQIRDIRGTAWILMHYAANYHSLGLIEQSIRCKISALDLVTILDDTSTLIDLQVSLAKSYVARAWQRVALGENGFSIYDGQIATAILFKVLEAHLDNFTPFAMEQAFHAIGEAFLILGRPDDALPNLKIALEASTRSGHYSSEARIQGALGYAYSLCGDYTRATKYLEEAIGTAPEATPVEDLSQIQLWYSNILEALGDPAAALIEARKAMELGQKAQQGRLERWAKLHDVTLGIGQALVSTDWIADQENGWIFTGSQIEDHERRVQRLLHDDLLTDVLNKKAALNLAMEKGLPFAAIFEISDMDKINARFGRRVGDEVLRNTASVLVATLSKESVVGRYSGNEFFVATSSDAYDEVIQAIRRFPWLAIDPELSVRVVYRRVNPGKPHLLAA